MKFQKQLNIHDPDNGVWGDCMRTALACLLNVYAEDVPHFYDGGTDNAKEKKQAWLQRQGFIESQIVFNKDQEFGDKKGVPAVLAYMGYFNENLVWRLLGTSRTGCNHVVICRGGEIIWDTSINDSGIIGPADDDTIRVLILSPTF